MVLVKIGADNQIPLPKKLMKKFGIGVGSVLKVVEKKDGIILVNTGKRDLANLYTDEEFIKICREVGQEVFNEEYGKKT